MKFSYISSLLFSYLNVSLILDNDNATELISEAVQDGYYFVGYDEDVDDIKLLSKEEIDKILNNNELILIEKTYDADNGELCYIEPFKTKNDGQLFISSTTVLIQENLLDNINLDYIFAENISTFKEEVEVKTMFNVKKINNINDSKEK